MVSEGVTANMASIIPAPRPADMTVLLQRKKIN